MLKKKLCTALVAMSATILAASNAEAISICIDPGHGGEDPGATGCSLVESEINLSVSKKLETLMKAAGYTVYMTRTSDATVSLSGRSSFANSKGVTTFASIHTNSAEAVATGIETYCYNGQMGNKSGTQAKNIQTKMVAAWPLANRGAKEANFHVVRETSMPATLTELGFINNCSKDATYLKDDSHRNSAAKAHCEALVGQWGGTASACGGSTGGGGGGGTTSTGSVMGFVLEGASLDSNAPKISGAKYTCGSKSVTSSADTVSKFELPVGNYTCKAEKDGYKTNTRSDCAAVTAGGTSWCSVNIPKAEVVVQNGTASGAVKDSVSGGNIKATVSVAGGDTKSYDGSTNWSFSLKPGAYTIKATSTGYDDGSVTCNVTSNATANCPITLNPKKAKMHGAVIDKASGAKVSGTVSLGTNTQNYDANNDWSFDVNAGTYTITATVPGYNTGTVSCTAGKGETKACNIEVTKTVTVVEIGTLRGTVADTESGELITADVSIKDLDQSYHYTGTGQWQLTPPVGTYTVSATAEGYEAGSSTCGVKANEVTQCPIKLKAKAVPTSGRVYDIATNSSVPAEITITDKDGTKQTISYDGLTNWTLDLKPGSYDLSAKADGYISPSATCIVKAGASATCDAAIAKEGSELGTLSGIVHDARSDGYLVAATVAITGGQAFNFNPFSSDCDNNACKTWNVEGLAVGEYTITASAPGYYTNTATCKVVAKEVGSSLCKIALTAKEDADNPTNIETGASPTIMIQPIDSDCSITSVAHKHGTPFGLLAIATALGSALALRRRKDRKGE